MSVLKLAIEAPKLCGARNAERFGKVAELIYEYEAKTYGSVFAKNADDEDDPKNRLAAAFAWKPAKGKEAQKQYIMDLIAYAMELHYKAEHGADIDLEPMRQDLSMREPLYPEVSAIQPVAKVRAAWLG